MTKNTSPNRSAFSQRQLNVNITGLVLPLGVLLSLNRTTLACVKRHFYISFERYVCIKSIIVVSFSFENFFHDFWR